jgi:CelD/BcsL family acetyltransferase involved in cellulose biosynthesis
MELITARERFAFTIAASFGELDKSNKEWERLWRSCPHATPFQAPGWLLPYIRIFKPELLRALLVRRDDVLVGLFPFIIDETGATRVLRLLGDGLSDYLDGLCTEEDRAEVSGLVEVWLADTLECCEYAEFTQLRKGAILSTIPRPNVFREEIYPGVLCPAVVLPPPSRAGELPISVSTLRNMELSLRQLKKLGTISFEIADTSSIDDAISNLFLLHAKRWRRRGLPGVFDTEQKQTFYRLAFRELKQSSTAELFTLYRGETPLASLAALRKDRNLYYYIGAFDPEYARFGPGKLMIQYAIDFAAKNGCELFDFLRGCEPYKYKWGAKDQEVTVRRIWKS